MIIQKDTFSNITIAVIGDIILDQYLIGDINRISSEAPIPVVDIKNTKYVLGGAANVIVNLLNLGCNVFLYGLIGNDFYGNIINDLLSKHNNLIKHIYSILPQSIYKTRILSQNKQVARYDCGVVTDIDFQNIVIEMFNNLEKNIQNIDAVILSDYGYGFLQKEFCQKIIQLCNKYNIKIFVDPRNVDWSIYYGATCITPNIKELICLEKNKNIQHILYEYAFDNMVLTKGKDGMVLYVKDKEPVYVLPYNTIDVYDVSGAGDTVISVLAACIVSNMNWLDSIQWANKAASIVVSKLYTSPILLNELIYGIQKNMDMIDLWKNNNQKIVFTNGCFDLLHMGHIHLLQEAKKLGDKLVVGLNSDQSIQKLKGVSRPIISQEERKCVLQNLSCVDSVILFDELTADNIINLVQPNVIVKGNDYNLDNVDGKQYIKENNIEVHFIPLLQNISTSKIIESIKRKN